MGGLGAFFALFAVVSFRLRSEIREQIIARDAEVLYSVALMRLSGTDDEGLFDPWIETEGDVLDVVLETSKLRDVLGVRLFDWDGRLRDAIPTTFVQGDLSQDDLESIKLLQPISRYHEAAQLSAFFIDPSARAHNATFPLLEVIIPLHRNAFDFFGEDFAGVGQYLIDGRTVEAEFEQLDDELALALSLLGGGSVVFAVFLIWTIYRLENANKLLNRRRRELMQANQELTMAAKSSAIGAVTAHLIHGLKNPLSGLEQFVTNRDSSGDGSGDDEWQVAAESTRRMQNMITEIVDVLRDENMTSGFTYTLEEVAQLVRERAAPIAEDAGVVWETGEPPSHQIDSRCGNILILILMNLVRNAIESTPPGKRVWLHMQPIGDRIEIVVGDQGSGIPESVRSDLFNPVRSTKEGGSGIGLAISQQLSRHIEADLALVRSDERGTEFAICLPLRAGQQSEIENTG